MEAFTNILKNVIKRHHEKIVKWMSFISAVRRLNEYMNMNNNILTSLEEQRWMPNSRILFLKKAKGPKFVNRLIFISQA